MGLAALLAVALASPLPASAAGRAPAGTSGKAARSSPEDPAEAKLDKRLRDRFKKNANEESDVIVEFVDGADYSGLVKGFGRAGKKLPGMNGRAMRLSNGLLKKLAENSQVKRIVEDRAVESFNGRTAVTVGARAVYENMGYRGAGIGVAVIDSGITPWHDDLTVANRQGQRVVHFKDFVNGRTAPYDDWGHGTHVAGTIAGNGYDSKRTREAIAPGANIIALKALGANGAGRISNLIAAIDYAISVKDQYNIRVINMSLGAGVYESYRTDPLTLAAKRAVDAGIVVVAAAGNMGRGKDGRPQYGAIGSPANAPWVLTVGASSTEGTVDRRDDKIAGYSSRGPTMIDFNAKPDLVAPGSGTVSLAVANSTLYLEKAPYLMKGSLSDLGTLMPYLALSGTSMATPVVSGSVALMLEANPNLTPNMVKAILQYTAQVYTGYDFLTQGAGFLNTKGAVTLAAYFRTGHTGMKYPKMKGWSQHIFWGNVRVRGGVLTPGGTAWATNVVWGDSLTPNGKHIIWGENCDAIGTCENDNITWGNNLVWGNTSGSDDLWWGDTDRDNIVWGNSIGDVIQWADGTFDNIVWGNTLPEDNIVWGNDCDGANCEAVVWGAFDPVDNIQWGNAEGFDNIVWGNTAADNMVWGNSGDEDVSWGNSAEADPPPPFGDDEADVNSFDNTLWDALFESAFPDTTTTTDPVLTEPAPAPTEEALPPPPPATTEPVTQPTLPTAPAGGLQ